MRKEEEGWLFSGRCLRVRVDKTRICPHYLSWFFGLEGFKEHIRRIAVGATMPSINTKILADVPIYFPPLAEQKAIAAVLGALDDKIELNRRMKATLEAMARAIFQSWFVDFDPVRAKLDGRKPAKPRPRHRRSIPERVRNSGLGPVTERLECGSCRRGVVPNRDGTVRLQSPETTSCLRRVPVVRGGNLTNGFVDDDFVFLPKPRLTN